jgi:DNA-binding CsgD family transcriptional regulator/exonuclease VII small subunit
LILGRDIELSELRRFLGSAPAGPSALLLEGAAGIGKTTLWLEGIADARRMGYRTLVTRAAGSEATFSYAALGDLFAEHLSEALPALPAPQARALEAALMRTEAEGVSSDPWAVSLASLAVLRSLAAAGPLVVAIDDVQWLDAPSARVLSFALRRLTDEPIAFLSSLRIGPGSAGDPLSIDRTLARTERQEVGPMQEGPLGRLLRDRTGADLPRPVVVRLHRVSHGNPLFALEIARAMVRGGVRPEPGEPLPVPEDLQQLLSARLASLPEEARSPLLAIAAMSQPTVELALAAASPEHSARAGLAHAEEAGVIERADGRVRFTHPLLASTVYVNASAGERRDLHVRLAGLVSDAEERARHLALASERPDAEVAVALDEAARHARARAAPDAAAELAELARQLTPPEDVDSLRARSLQAAEYHFDAGDASQALGVLKDAIASSPPGRERAQILFRLSAMSWMNLIHGVREPAEQAALEAGEDRELLSDAHMALTWVAFYLGDLEDAWHHAQRSVEHAQGITDPGTRADALATLGFVQFMRGQPADALMTEALELQDLTMREGSWTEGSVYTTPRSILGLELMWSGDLEEARRVFEHELAEYEKHAMYTVRQEVLCYLAELECRAGRWEIAAGYAAEAMETVIESGQTETQAHVALFNQALAAAHLGHVDDARSWASEGVRLALKNDDLFNANWNRAVLGFLELSSSNFEQAHANLEPVVEYLERMRSAEPGFIPCIPDEVEALVALGRVEEAEPLVDRLEAQGRALDRAWALATGARCRGLIAAARGDLEAAHLALERALEEHERVAQPFERARSLLILGRIERRAKQKRAARSSIERARDVFSELGASLWSALAESELARIGGRPARPLELTATEQEVARLVAEGRTNREVADALFMSPSTVQANLKRIFGKLGVRSRTELAARVDRATEHPEPDR